MTAPNSLVANFKQVSPNVQGICFLVLGMFILTLQNVAIRFIQDGYAVLEIVTVRSIIAIPLTLLFYRYEGQRGLPHTNRGWLQFARGFLLFVAYTTYFMGLAAITLADAAAIRFASPLFITFLSVVILGEAVGIRRWFSLLVGFAGVLLIIQPGASNFNLGTLFILTTSILYALSAIITRQLRSTDSSATMSYFSTLVYLISALIIAPLVAFVGESTTMHPSIAFLFRAWAVPSLTDFAVMVALGFIWSSGMYCVAKAYSTAQASVAAPFEYMVLPINVMWGFMLWRETPTIFTWLGSALTVVSGLYILYRDQVRQKK
ncbi:MAG: DMT family transporter [Chloroflexota bacterium]